MTFGDWILLAALLGTVIASWMVIRIKVAVLETRLKNVERNHIPTLTDRLDSLPCQNHLEEIVKHTARLEAVAERLEKVERHLNG